jgi:hypothetical protein
VTSIAAPSGSTTGGTSVTITGTGFVAGATVTIGGQPCTNVVVVSATSITCTTPAGATGAKDVVVTNPDTQAGTLTGGYTYTDGGGGGGGSASNVPGAPAGVNGQGGIGSADVSWNPPASDGGSPITGYSVRYSIDGEATWTTASMCAGVEASCSVTGLTNGTSYVFAVRASNANGDSEWSANSAAVTVGAGSGSLPVTGLEPAQQLAGALLLVALGIVLELARRRRMPGQAVGR